MTTAVTSSPERGTIHMASISEGDALRADITGKTYRVKEIEDGKAFLTRVAAPVRVSELESDIESGALTKL